MSPEALAVIGTIVTMVLGINAYFVKQLVDNINETKISVAVLVTQNNSKDIELKRINGDVLELKAVIKTMSHQLVALEVKQQLKEEAKES